METRKIFRLKLTSIASLLGTEQLERLKYLCQDDIPHGDRERIKTPEQLFLELEQRQVITPNSLQFLIDCLENVGRKDLAEDLRNFECLKRQEAGADSVAANSLDSLHQEAESYNLKGRVAFQERRYENACQQYTAALECLPEDQGKDARAKYLCNRAACYVKQRKFNEACTDCEKALLLDPHHKKARYRLAQALQGQGKLAKAFEEVTVLQQRNPEDHGIIQLWSSVKKEVEEAKDAAMKKRRNGQASFLKSRYDEAISNFSEGILLLPNVDMYAEDMMQFYWKRAECYLKKDELENAKRDCVEANRLVPENPMVLNTMMQALERLKEYNDCYAVCNKLIKMKVKETEAENTKSRILPKMLSQDDESNKPPEANTHLPEMANSKKSKKKRKGSRKKKNKGEGSSEGQEMSSRGSDELSPNCSSITESSLSVREGIDASSDDTLPRAEFNQDKKEAGRTAEDEDPDVAMIETISCSLDIEMLPKTAREDSQMMETFPLAPETEDRIVLDKAQSISMDKISGDSGLLPSTDITGLLENDVAPKSREEDSQMLESVPCVPDNEDKIVLDKAEARYFPNTNIPLTDSSTGDSFPRRILLICDRWSCWHHSESTVNRQLCQSFARNGDLHVACLVLDATDQETIAATRDGVNLIKAASQPGIPQGNKELLHLHSDFPFNADLVVGHGMVSGTAAAIQSNRMNCRRLHIFHNLPGDGQGRPEDLDSVMLEETERDLALGAEFVAGVGPLVVEQWEAILNRKVYTIIPGLPSVAPRNQIMTPQYRCLILGDMNNSAGGGLNLVTAAIAACRQRKSIHLTVVGTEREMVSGLTKEVKAGLRTGRVKVKPLDVSQEVVGVEIRGVSLVMIPFPFDGFGMVALEAIAAKVPILVSSENGVAKFLQSEFDEKFLKFVCSAGNDTDCEEAWTDAIDNILSDREEAFALAENLQKQWNLNFTWDLTSDKLFKHFSNSGLFSVVSPSAYTQMTLPSQCSDSALRFMKEEVDLLNRRRKHVLFLSPERIDESPFIHYFAQVPWAGVFDFDVNSVKTGYLASCENFCESMGMKICRILPPTPDEDRKKFLVGSLTGIPWVLLEGMPESKRSIKGNLEWIREFFLALGKTYQVPITFTVLWKSSEETEASCKSLSKILTVVQGSSLFNQVKLVVVSTGDKVSGHLADIAEDWGVEVERISLEDVCNALCQCVNSSPFIQGDRDFSLPVADPDDPQKVTFKELPPSSRWIIVEMEVLFQSVGSTPQFDKDDACHFYRGGLISWYALQMGYAIERSNWKALKAKVDELLLGAGTLTLKMPHQRGAGGSTSARKILFDYHESYPCVSLKSVGHPEVAQAIKVVAEFCRLPVIILADCKQLQGDEFDIDTLYNILSNERIPCVVLEVIHQSQTKGISCSRGSEKAERTVPFRLADVLDVEEGQKFVEIYATQRKNKLSSLNVLLHRGPKQLQIPFFYALTTFEDRFTALEPFVKECLEHLDLRQQKILLFLAMAYHYGHNSLSANEFTVLLEAPRREVILLERVLPELSMELLLEEDDKWRPRHDLIAVEMLRQLLTMTRPEGLPAMHPDNWQNQLAEKALDFFEHMSEAVVSDVLISRIIDDSSHQYVSFSQLITDVPIEDDAIKLFEKAISLYPDNPFFKVHLGRYYSIQKRLTGIDMAIKYTDEGIFCSQNLSRLARGQFAQMKGVVYSRQVSYLVEQSAELETVIKMALEGVENFRRAVSIAPDFVDGYIPEVRMMCKVFEYIERKTGNFCEYVKSNDAHPFIIDAISNTSNTLECVPDSDQYAIWRARLACLGRRHFSPAQVGKTLELLYHLQASGRASRGSINRQIVVMRMDMCREQKHPLSAVAGELIELLNEALRFDPNVEQTMRLWVRLAPFIRVPLPESESKIFNWCSKEKSVRSYLYKYIIAFLHLLEGGSPTYSEIMQSAKDDLVSGIKAINRPDVGRCRHPDRPVVWLGQQGKGMGHLLNLDDKISEFKYVRMKRFMDSKYTKQLRPLTGLIVKTGLKVGTIRINDELDVSFRADLCEKPLTSSHFINRKVQFFLAFTFFGTDAYNVRLVAE